MTPYIRSDFRSMATHSPRSPGELTYAFMRLAREYMKRAPNGPSFAVYAEVLAALEATKLEFYRRDVSPYEDAKLAENGDV